MFINLLIISSVLILIALAGLGIRMLLESSGKFPETHVGHNRQMKKLGISCAKNIDVGCHPDNELPGCAACRKE
ncbi:MAG: hypothetical protein RBS37_00580 [Bacteroidales bacterium]|jgi:hypothetical protein|nr:hypothetical protein [Bacteroidales bacterium]